jgi:hypothetical protein
MLVGQDKSGALVPSGLLSGATPAGSNMWCIFVYQAGIDGFSINPKTGTNALPGDYVVLAAPADAAPGIVTLVNGTVVNVQAADIVWAHACNLFPSVQTGSTTIAGVTTQYSYGVSRPIGCTLHNVLQYIGGVTVLDKTLAGGILYRLEGMVPTGFQVMNYMHEQGTAIQTQYELRVPWIGATTNTLQTLANADGVTGYVQGYGRTHTHYTGTPQIGNGVAFSSQIGDAGNFSDFNFLVHTPVDLIGRIHGVLNMIDKIGYLNRVKTLWDPSRMVGPMKDPNSAAIMMGGSATAGLPYDLSLTTDGLFKLAKTQKKPVHPDYGTYVLIRVNL